MTSPYTARGVYRMFPGTLGGRSRIASPGTRKRAITHRAFVPRLPDATLLYVEFYSSGYPTIHAVKVAITGEVLSDTVLFEHTISVSGPCFATFRESDHRLVVQYGQQVWGYTFGVGVVMPNLLFVVPDTYGTDQARQLLAAVDTEQVPADI